MSTTITTTLILLSLSSITIFDQYKFILLSVNAPIVSNSILITTVIIIIIIINVFMDSTTKQHVISPS